MKNSKKTSIIYSRIALGLGVLEILLILLSWLINAANGSSTAVRSMLSAEGIRWLFGHFTENMATPLLIWIILLSIAYGAVKTSGITNAIKIFLNKKERMPFRNKIALYLVAIELLLMIIVILLLTIPPHAILLSINGTLYPSSFSNSLIPTFAFAIIVVSVSYALMSGMYQGLPAILKALTYGISKASTYIFIYILAVQLYYSILFVFPTFFKVQ